MTTPTTPLTFEVGKTYLCRDGTSLRKVVHIKTNGGLVVLDEREHSASHNPEGRMPNIAGRDSKLDLVAEYREPVVKKIYSRVVQKVGGNDYGSFNKVGCFQISGNSNVPVPYINNNVWEHRAVLEVVITDDEVTAVNIIKD